MAHQHQQYACSCQHKASHFVSRFILFAGPASFEDKLSLFLNPCFCFSQSQRLAGSQGPNNCVAVKDLRASRNWKIQGRGLSPHALRTAQEQTAKAPNPTALRSLRLPLRSQRHALHASYHALRKDGHSLLHWAALVGQKEVGGGGISCGCTQFLGSS